MNKIVLIGAGSTNFGLGTISDIFKSKLLEGSTIVLHDINPKTLIKTDEWFRGSIRKSSKSSKGRYVS